MLIFKLSGNICSLINSKIRPHLCLNNNNNNNYMAYFVESKNHSNLLQLSRPSRT